MVSIILSCRLCAYNAWMPVMALFTILRLACLAGVAWRRLDVVRVLLTFGAMELAWHQVFGACMLRSVPGEDTHMVILSLFELLHATGVPAVFMLMLASRISFLRGRHPGMSWRQSFKIVPAWTLLMAGQVVWQTWRQGGH